jgi:hypothetical protein
MGLIAMSERYLQRIEVLSKVTNGRTTLVSAPHVLGLSTRQVRRLLGRIRTSLDVDQFFVSTPFFARIPIFLAGPVLRRVCASPSLRRGRFSHQPR